VAGINLIAFFFFFPETDFERKLITGDQSSETTSDSPKMDADDEKSHGNNVTEQSGIPKKSFIEQLKPWSRINPHASYIHLLLRPLPLILYPSVFFSFLIFSTTLTWIVCYVDTAASVYQAPPFLMNIGVSGLYNVPAIIAIPFGAFVGGALTDWISKTMARRNNGIFEPEYRLISLIVPFFFVPVGLLMYP
jgi:hypothetical protein